MTRNIFEIFDFINKSLIKMFKKKQKYDFTTQILSFPCFNLLSSLKEQFKKFSYYVIISKYRNL